MKKRVLSMFMALALCLTLLPTAALAEETPVGRLGSADEVAKLLVFLAGEDAGYITGQVFGVNGGLVI